MVHKIEVKLNPRHWEGFRAGMDTIVVRDVTGKYDVKITRPSCEEE